MYRCDCAPQAKNFQFTLSQMYFHASEIGNCHAGIVKWIISIQVWNSVGISQNNLPGYFLPGFFAQKIIYPGKTRVNWKNLPGKKYYGIDNAFMEVRNYGNWKL